MHCYASYVRCIRYPNYSLTGVYIIAAPDNYTNLILMDLRRPVHQDAPHRGLPGPTASRRLSCLRLRQRRPLTCARVLHQKAVTCRDDNLSIFRYPPPGGDLLRCHHGSAHGSRWVRAGAVPGWSDDGVVASSALPAARYPFSPSVLLFAILFRHKRIIFISPL